LELKTRRDGKTPDYVQKDCSHGPNIGHGILSLVELVPQRDEGQHMHDSNHDAHEDQAVGHVHIRYHHVLEENLRAAEVAIHRSLGALQKGSIHAVNGVQRPVESGPEVTQVPHPSEEGRDVDVARAESKNGEHNRQNGSQKHGKLRRKDQLLPIGLSVSWSSVEPTLVGNVAPTKKPQAWALKEAIMPSSMK